MDVAPCLGTRVSWWGCGCLRGGQGSLGRSRHPWRGWGSLERLGIPGEAGDPWRGWGGGWGSLESWGSLERSGILGEFEGKVGDPWRCWGSLGRLGILGEVEGDVGDPWRGQRSLERLESPGGGQAPPGGGRAPLGHPRFPGGEGGSRPSGLEEPGAPGATPGHLLPVSLVLCGPCRRRAALSCFANAAWHLPQLPAAPRERDPINPPGARGTGSRLVKAPANEGRGEAQRSRLAGACVPPAPRGAVSG